MQEWGGCSNALAVPEEMGVSRRTGVLGVEGNGVLLDAVVLDFFIRWCVSVGTLVEGDACNTGTMPRRREYLSVHHCGVMVRIHAATWGPTHLPSRSFDQWRVAEWQHLAALHGSEG